MGLYRYSADDGDILRSGEVSAASLPQAIRNLQCRGLRLNEVAAMSRAGEMWGRRHEIERVWLYRHLADLLASGVTLSAALEVLAQDAPCSADAVRLRTMSQLVAGQGLTLSEAMEQHPTLIGSYGIAVVRSAEQANRLPESLRMLAAHLDNSNRIRERSMTPIVYPAIILIWMGVVFVFLTTFILPKFMDLFLELGMTQDKFPLPTLMAIRVSNAAPFFLFWLVVLLLAFALLRVFLRRSKRVQLDLAMWSLWMPIFGRLNRDCATARILGVLALALEAGMPLDRALEAAGPAAENELMNLAMRRAVDRARRGYSAGKSIAGAGILPPALVWHLQTAEKSGHLAATCQAAAETYIARVEMHTVRTAAVLEPLLIIFVGICVGFVGLSMFLPLAGIIGELSS